MDPSAPDGGFFLTILSLCCCCLVVIAAGGGGFYLWRRSQKKPAGVIDVSARPVETPRMAETPRPTPAAPPITSQETIIYKRPVAEPPPPVETPKVEPVVPINLPSAGEDVPSASFTEAPTMRWPAPDLTITPPEDVAETARALGEAAETDEVAQATAADAPDAEPAAVGGGLFGLPSVTAPDVPAARDVPAAPDVSDEPDAPELTLPLRDEPPAAPVDPQQTIMHMPRPTMPDLPSAADPNQTIVSTPRSSSAGRAPDIRTRLLALNGADKPYEVSESGFRIMFAPKAITGYLLEIAFDFITGSARFTESGPVDDGRIKRDAREVLESSGWTVE
jgi:hypothetical protein